MNPLLRCTLDQFSATLMWRALFVPHTGSHEEGRADII